MIVDELIKEETTLYGIYLLNKDTDKIIFIDYRKNACIEVMNVIQYLNIHKPILVTPNVINTISVNMGCCNLYINDMERIYYLYKYLKNIESESPVTLKVAKYDKEKDGDKIEYKIIYDI